MKAVKLQIISDDKNDRKPASVFVETKRADSWVRRDGKDIATGDAVSTFNVRPGERVIVEIEPLPDMVYDRDQGAAINPNLQRNDDGRADSPADNKGNAPSKQVVEQENARIAKAQGLEKVPNPASTGSGQMSPKPGSAPGTISGTNFKPNPEPETSPNAAVPKSGPHGETIASQTKPDNK